MSPLDPSEKRLCYYKICYAILHVVTAFLLLK